MIFTGTSRYSTDFQSVVNRAVSIASLHLNQLESGKTTFDNRSAALDVLQTKFQSLQSALSAVESGTGASSFGSSVSNTGVVSVSLAGGATEGSYGIRVTDLGARTSTMSKDALTVVTDPSQANIHAGPAFTLTVNGVPATITPASQTLNALAAAINQAGAGVQATVVNVGSTASPDYRLSVGSNAYDAVTVTLAAGATPLLDTMAAGSKAAYTVNGVAVPTDSRTVTLAPGLTMSLEGESAAGVTTTVSVSRSTTAAKNALSAFANAYNAVVETLDTHRGQGGGALAGDALLNTLTGSIRNLVNFEADSGAFSNLAALGMTFDEDGVLQFSASGFDAATQGNATGLFSFLDDFTAAVSDVLESLAGPTGGMIASALENVEESIAQQERRIQDEQDRLELFETTLTARINEADALIAALEQKVNYVTGMFESMRAASRMYGA